MGITLRHRFASLPAVGPTNVTLPEITSDGTPAVGENVEFTPATWDDYLTRSQRLLVDDVEVTLPTLLAPQDPSGSGWTNTAVTSSGPDGNGYYTIAKTSTATNARKNFQFTAAVAIVRMELLAGTDDKCDVALHITASTSSGSARKISGPATTNDNESFSTIAVTGLHASDPTIIEVERTNNADFLRIYPGRSTSTTNGASIKVRNIQLLDKAGNILWRSHESDMLMGYRLVTGDGELVLEESATDANGTTVVESDPVTL